MDESVYLEDAAEALGISATDLLRLWRGKPTFVDEDGRLSVAVRDVRDLRTSMADAALRELERLRAATAGD